jgi:hypothetical protein
VRIQFLLELPGRDSDPNSRYEYHTVEWPVVPRVGERVALATQEGAFPGSTVLFDVTRVTYQENVAEVRGPIGTTFLRGPGCTIGVEARAVTLAKR